jgi:hypothetical protein
MNYLELLISQSARSLLGDDLLVSISIMILFVGAEMFFGGIFSGLGRGIIFYLFFPVAVFIVVSLWLFSAPSIVIITYLFMAALVSIGEALYKQKRRFDLEILLTERRHRMDMEEDSREN